MGLFTKKPAKKPVKEGAIASFATSKRFPASKVLASLDEFDLGLESTVISGDWAVVQSAQSVQDSDPVTPNEAVEAADEPYKPMSQSEWIRSLNRVQESPFESTAPVDDAIESALPESDILSDEADSCDPLTHWNEPINYDETEDEIIDHTPIVLGDGDYTEDDMATMLPHEPSAEQHKTLDYLSRPTEQRGEARSMGLIPDEATPGPTLANEIDEESFWDMMNEQPVWSGDASGEADVTSEMPVSDSIASEVSSIDQWTQDQLANIVDEEASNEMSGDASGYAAEYSMDSLTEATSTSAAANAALLESLQGELDRDAWAELAAEPYAEPPDDPETSSQEPTIAESVDVSKDFGQRIRLLMERANEQDTWVPNPEAVASILAPAPPPPPIVLPLTSTMMAAGAVIIPQTPAKATAPASFVVSFVGSIAPPLPAPTQPMVVVEPEAVAEPVNETIVEDQITEALPPPIQQASAFIDTLPLETRQSLADEGIMVIAGEQIAPDLQVLLVEYEGVTALMADNGENAILLKTFEANPLGDPEGQALGFHVNQQAVTGNRVLFTVQAGAWQGVLTLDSDEVALQLEY